MFYSRDLVSSAPSVQLFTVCPEKTPRIRQSAELKLPRWVPPNVRGWHLHGSAAVAELKPCNGKRIAIVDSSPRLRSRGRIEASATISLRRSFEPHLHGSAAVAELKRPSALAFRLVFPGSPRLRSRGRIEAPAFRDAVVCPILFVEQTNLHGSAAVAELKHHSWGRADKFAQGISTAPQPWPN